MIYSGAICSIFEDICIILLPVWELKALNLSLTQRVGVMFMFTFGSLYVSFHPPFVFCHR